MTPASRGAYRRLMVVLPAVVAVLSRLPALAGGWVWDDLIIVRSQLGAFHSLASVFFPPPGIPDFSAHYYRPLTTASFLIDHALYGERPFGFHLTVLAAHAAAATLVFLLARSFLRTPEREDLPALGAALIFAVHPVLAESVCWVAGRADVLATAFLMGSALALRKRSLSALPIAAGALLFGAACLFKEVALAFLPLVPLFASDHLGRSGPANEGPGRVEPLDQTGSAAAARGARWGAGATITFALVAAGVLLLRMWAIGGLGAEAPSIGGGALMRGIGGALWFYLPRVLLPLRAEPFVDTVPGGAAAWLGLASAVVVAGAGTLLILVSRRRGLTLVGVGMVSFLVLLTPSLVPAVMNVGSSPMAERYLYAPIAGLSIGLAGALSLVPRSWRRSAAAGLLAAVVLLGAVSFSRSTIWSDDITLWSTAARSAKGPYARIQLATALSRAGRIDEAQSVYGELLAMEDRLNALQRAKIRIGIGVLFSKQGRSQDALRQFAEGVRLDPRSALGWYNLASAHWRQFTNERANGDVARRSLEACAEAVHRAHELAALDPPVLLLLGRAEEALGHTDKAREAYLQAAEIDPGGVYGAEARGRLGLIGPRRP